LQQRQNAALPERQSLPREGEFRLAGGGPGTPH